MFYQKCKCLCGLCCCALCCGAFCAAVLCAAVCAAVCVCAVVRASFFVVFGFCLLYVPDDIFSQCLSTGSVAPTGCGPLMSEL